MREEDTADAIDGHAAVSLERPGIYVFALANERVRRVAIGRLGPVSFERGMYLYVGSARGPGGIAARLRHHWRPAASPRWHLDYLRRRTRPAAAWIGLDDNQRECSWATLLGGDTSLSPGPAGFGASDCRCQTHLFFCADSAFPPAGVPPTLARRIASLLSSTLWLNRRNLAKSLGLAQDGGYRDDAHRSASLGEPR